MIQAEAFEALASSSKGIAKLRELILELAVRGLLVAQDPNDEPASVLLEKIAEEKAKLVKDRKIKKQNPLIDVANDEKLFELPTSWIWTRLGSCGVGNTGKTPSTGNPKYFGGEIQFIGPGQITLDGKILESDKTLTEEGCEYSTIAHPGDILMVCIGGSIGKSAITKSVVAFNQQINCIRPLLIDSRFLNFALNAPYFQTAILTTATGSATPIINRSKWEELLIPLPPLAEQHRIVAKVDELMALCDQLEQHQSHSSTVHQRLLQTLLESLTQAVDNEAFQKIWSQIAAHFDTLFITEASIDQLKQVILQLAVMGKLVPRDPSDEPASVLLKKIAEEKARMVKEGKIKKQTPLPEVTELYEKSELPKGWVVTRFGELFNLISGQHLKPQEYSESYETGMIPYLTGPAEFGEKYPSVTRYTFEKRAVANPGDVLVTCKGSGVGKLNKVETEIAISRQLMSIQPILITTKFTKLLASSLYDQIRSNIVGIAIPGISREDLMEIVIALPPLAEQYRIVAKVDELMAICDQLKSRISKSQQTQEHLAAAIVEKAVA